MKRKQIMSQYSRKEKHQDSNRPSRSEKVKQSLSLFQMIVATIASLLGIIVTSFTIYSIMKPTTKTEEKKDSSTSVVVVHEKDGSATDSSATGTDISATSSQASDASSEQTDSSQVETSASEAPAETTPSATDTESSAN